MDLFTKSYDSKFEKIQHEFGLEMTEKQNEVKVEFSKTEIKMSELKHQNLNMLASYEDIQRKAGAIAKKEIEKVVESLRGESQRLTDMELHVRRID